MHLDRRLVHAGAFLVALGGVPLLVQGGALDSARIADALRLWPALLILAGVGMILARTRVRGFAGLLCAVTIGLIGGGLIAGGGAAIGIVGCGGSATTPVGGTGGTIRSPVTRWRSGTGIGSGRPARAAVGEGMDGWRRKRNMAA
ncbi:MAG TPA: hypothetical protein VNF73_13315, partial [Candidatus Saccharimonadales bacterium]|nr:hypothetical protein [Candidatus Saccharimonadales bacterium]